MILDFLFMRREEVIHRACPAAYSINFVLWFVLDHVFDDIFRPWVAEPSRRRGRGRKCSK